MMDVATVRFGKLQVEAEDILHFPSGVLGMESCQRWVLLADAQNSALGWLQSVDRPEIAFGVVSPRRFCPEYKIRIAWQQLSQLNVERPQDAQVLVMVSRNERGLTLNLKAPLVFNLSQGLGAQVVTRDDHPLQYAIPRESAPLRKSA